MRNKKAFTLIEIIVVIALLAIVMTSIFILINKNNTDNEEQKILNALVEAASVYMSIEKDEQGNTYEKGLFYGGTGVFIPINELYDKGYISDTVLKTLEKNEKYIESKNNNSAYLLAAVFDDNNDECKGNSIIEYKTSWNVDLTSGTKYLCPYKIDDDILSNIKYVVYDLNGGTVSDSNFKKINIVKKNENLEVKNFKPTKEGYTFKGWKDEGRNITYNTTNNTLPIDENSFQIILTAQYSKNEENIIKASDKINLKVDLTKTAVSKTFYDSSSAQEKDYLTYQENGLFQFYNEDTGNIYSYYRGAVTNNYLKLGKDKDNKDLYWRILWYSKNTNKMKLVLDKNVPIEITDKSNNKYTLDTDSKMYLLYSSLYGSSYNIYNKNIYSIYDGADGYVNKYTWKVSPSKFFDSVPQLANYSYTSNNFYLNKLKSWYNTTNLSGISYITKEKNFCYNECIKSSTSYTYTPSNNFECYTESSYKCFPKKENEYASSVVGFLTYGDVVRAGLSQTYTNYNNLNNSGNFLFNTNDSIYLADFNTFDRSWGEISYYTLSPEGIKTKIVYKKHQSSHCWDTNRYNLINIETNQNIISNVSLCSGSYLNEYSFVGSALKPTIIINTSSIKLDDSKGTKEDPYEIISK